MRKIKVLFILLASILLSSSCQKSAENAKGVGALSFADLKIGIDDELTTKATVPASGNYTIIVLDSNTEEVVRTTYSAVKANNDKICLPAGSYTLLARSSDLEEPKAAFEQPVYGASKAFNIEAGMTTSVGEIVCTLLQCKVTVDYSDEFLASVTGDGKTTVSLSAGFPLDYVIKADKTYDRSAGYFAVTGTTMEVVFNGMVDGKSQKMTKVFSGVAPKQWRQIRFVQKKNEQGQATFDILINDLISDAVLNNTIGATEDVIGEDPNAPKGDGGIKLELDHAAGCDSEITDMSNMLIVPVETRDMAIKLRATVPGGVKKFSVNIASTNEAFVAAVAAADATNLDLINPTSTNDIIFTVVPFPHGQELVGQTDIAFDLSAAQDAIIAYQGVHTFTMKIVDQNNCSKEIPVVMVVE